MPSCPKCGFDVSPALRVCGNCQTKLDGEPAAVGTAAPASKSAAETFRSVAVVLPLLVLTAGPIFAFRMGAPWPLVFAVWFGLAIAMAALGQKLGAFGLTPERRKIVHPFFGQLVTTTKGGGLDLWRGKLDRGDRSPLGFAAWSGPEGPSAVQQEAIEKILRDLDRLEALALRALGELDRSDWPEQARAAKPVLASIELEDDEDTLAGRFVFEYGAAEDPDADYYVEFQNGAVVDASRIA